MNYYSDGMELSNSCQTLLTEFICAEVHPKCVFVSPCNWISLNNTKMRPIGRCVNWIV